MTDSKNKYLIKNTAIFAVGNMASKFISFFLVPLYTNCMIAAEYGTADLLYTVCGFLTPLLTLNIIEAVLRFSLDKDANQKKILHTATIMVIPLTILGLISIPVLNMFDGFGRYALLFYFYLITNATSQLFLVALKGQEKLKLYSIGNVLHTLLIAILNIAFLLWLKMGVEGYFLAYILSNIIMIVYGVCFSHVIESIKETQLEKKLFVKMVKYSAILIPTNFMWWIMTFLDRSMISSMIGISESGIYAVSYKIPTILSSVSSVFMQAWLFSAIKNKNSEDNEVYSNNIFKTLSFILTTTSIPLLIFIKLIFKFYTAPEYFTAWEYVPSLMIGHIFLTLSTFISTSYNVSKDSRGMLKSASIGAAMNLILNFTLIPLIGVHGAAIATSISYITVFTYRLFNTRKYLKLKFTKTMLVSSLLVLLISLSLFLPQPINSIIELLSVGAYIMVNINGFKTIASMAKSIFKKLIKK